MGKQKFVDQHGKLCDLKYRITIKLSVMGDLATQTINAQAGSDKAVKECRKQLEKYLKESGEKLIAFEVEEVD